MRAIIALSAQGIRTPEVQLRDASDKGFTFISDGRNGSTLNQVVERQLATLPQQLGLRRVLLFKSIDSRIGLNIFDTYEQGGALAERQFSAPDGPEATLSAEAAALAQIKEYAAKPEQAAQTLATRRLGSHGTNRSNGGAELSLDDYLRCCSSAYVISHTSTPWYLLEQMDLFRAVAGGDDMAVLLNKYVGDASLGRDNALLTLAIPQTTARKAINHAIALLNLHEMELQRAQVIQRWCDGGVTMVWRWCDGHATAV